MMNPFGKRRASSILGLALEGNRLEAAAVRRSGSSLHLQGATSATLALAPLSGDPELVGRELRNHLDQAELRPRQCVVCLPASWILTMQVPLPELPEADVASFLQLEAERGFTSGAESLHIVHSRSRLADGTQYATLMAIPHNHLATLEKALKAAQLKPVTFSLGAAALGGAETDSSHGFIALAVGAEAIELAVVAGGGIMALRSLDGMMGGDGAQKRIDADRLAREIRITVGQLPPPVADGLRKVRVYGRGEMARQFVRDIAPRLEAMGLKAELLERSTNATFGEVPPAETAASPALALAANYLQGVDSGPEFLPPKVSQWKQLVGGKFSSKKLVWAGTAVGAVLLVVGGLFGWQSFEMAKWKAKWKEIEKPVGDVDYAKAMIRAYRPWYDSSYRELRLLREVTRAFPETGVVTAKTLELRDQTQVACTGVTRDNVSYGRVRDALQNVKGVSDLATDSLLGQSPAMQFSFKFTWEGVGSGN